MIAALRSSVFAIAAVLTSFAATYALCMRLGTNASPAILAAALCVGLMRRPERLDLRSLLFKLVALPLVALCAGLVAFAFRTAPLLGAAIFSCGIALSIVLRNYGERASAIGRTIALPLMAILVVPVRMDDTHGKLIPALLMLAAGAIAFAATSVAWWIAERSGIALEPQARRPERPRSQSRSGIPVASRMALQMLAALALAFAIGMLLIPAHWPWVVLTAFIVCSGAVGRGDAIYKGLLRLAGAIGGTFVAAIVASVRFENGVVYAAAVFCVLFVGIFLRQFNYAYWAACATLIFALLQGSAGSPAGPLFALRVLCIAAGAMCAVAATWFVYPIRTEQIVRRRIADALAALRDVISVTPGDPEHSARLAALDGHASELRRIAPPVRLHRTLFGAKDPEAHPAAWIDLMHALLEHARRPGFDRAHIGAEMRRLRAMLQRREAVSASDGEPPNMSNTKPTDSA
jgi:hypothetical protein